MSYRSHFPEQESEKLSLGATHTPLGTHFALYAPEKSQVRLVVQTPEQDEMSYALLEDRSGIWRIFIEKLHPPFFYGYDIDDTWVVDPYTRTLSTPLAWGEARNRVFGKVDVEEPFDWNGVKKPNHRFEELFIYEMHVRGFTQDSSSKAEHPGTFRGIIEKIPHLVELGINAVELMPVYSFNEHAHPDSSLCNFWGYSSESFFALMNPYGSRRDFQEMVHALHRAGIEVILDVVYNHVGCGWFDTLSRSTYFITHEGEHTNYTGCGNTVNTNAPQTMELILDSLRYFANEMQVDGFRFDLASIFCRDEDGCPMEHPPIIEAMRTDPSLANVKLIAEPWDCGGLYQVGTFPGDGRFAQWNGQFRDAIRRFIKGTDNAAGPFAAAMAGSATFKSINFITAHDGFTLQDLVSYNEKHNEANGEEGRDGSTTNESWNCGIEGKTDLENILALRDRQMKNFILALCFSLGTPMMLMGDEYGHTKMGNNNTYCQDNSLNYFQWESVGPGNSLFEFFKHCIDLRKKISIFQSTHFLDESRVEWLQPDWSPHSRTVAYQIKGTDQDLILAFNTSDAPFELQLPPLSLDTPWQCVINTALQTQITTTVKEKISLDPRSGLLILS